MSVKVNLNLIEDPTNESIADDHLSEKVSVLTRTMERMVKDIQKLKEEVMTLKANNMQMVNRLTNMSHDVNETAFDVGADMDLRRFMMDESQQDAYDMPMDPSDVEGGISNMKNRRSQHGMHNNVKQRFN